MHDSERSSDTQVVVCPYCGETQPAMATCRSCRGAFEPLSRQATHNAMGPWFVRDPRRPYLPGSSYETLTQRVDRGEINRYSILRGPTTRQFWTVARRVPGVAHLLGYCHSCDARVERDAGACPDCGESFAAYLDRNMLGLPDIRPLPGEAPEVDLPRSSSDRAAGPPRDRFTGDSSAPGVVADLERKVRRQQAVIRTLTGLVFVVAAIGATASIVAVAAQSAAQSAARSAARSSGEAVSAPPLDGPSDVGALTPGAGALDSPTRTNDSPAASLPESEIPGDTPTEEKNHGTAGAIEDNAAPIALSLLESDDPLRELLLTARDETRGVVDRFAAYDDAIRALRERLGDEPELGTLLEESEAELELLRFREFHPGSS